MGGISLSGEPHGDPNSKLATISPQEAKGALNAVSRHGGTIKGITSIERRVSGPEAHPAAGGRGLVGWGEGALTAVLIEARLTR